MGEGDPRGELIALELRKPERWPLLARWLASHLEGGDLYVVGGNLAWLDEPIGEFCRGVSLFDRLENVVPILAAVARRPRPWLTSIKVMAGFGTLVLSERLCEAVPNLSELELIGAHDLREFVHPTLAKLHRSVRSLEGGNELALQMYLPAVTHCTLELEPWKREWHAERVTLEHLPALRSLDLAPSGAGSMARGRPAYGHLDVIHWLRDRPFLPRLDSLTVPAVRTQAAAEALMTIATAYPQLAIHIDKHYTRYPFGEQLVPRATLAAPWPWPPPDEADDPWELRVTLPDGDGFDLFHGSLATGTERDFDTANEEFRAMWRELWASIDACKKRPQQIRFGLLHRAIAAWRAGDPSESTEDMRRRVVAAAQKVGPEVAVTIAPKPAKR